MRFRCQRRDPVGAWRQRAARANLRRIRDCRSLKLAQLEKAVEEYAEPLLDRGQVILPALSLGELWRPLPCCAVAPGVPREIRNFTRPQSKPGNVVQVKILQFVRANGGFAALGQSAGCRVVTRYKFRRKLGVKNVL